MSEAPIDDPTADLVAALAAWSVDEPPWLKPAWQRCGLSTAAESSSSAADVRRHVEEFLQRAGAQGWVETTHMAQRVGHGQSWHDAAPLLNAELCAGAESLHVRQLDGEWLLCRLTEDPAGQDVFVADDSYAAADDAAEPLCYRVYLRLQDGVPCMEAARYGGGPCTRGGA